MKKPQIIKISFVILLFILTGCSLTGNTGNSEPECDCCTEGLLESAPIQDLIDGDNEWMGLVIGETNPSDVLSYFSGENISYCVSSMSEEICDGNVEDILTRPRGVISLTLLDFNCQPFGIPWEAGKIISIDFSCENCISISELMGEIDAVPYIYSNYFNLHETEIISILYYPEYGLRIATTPMDRKQAYLVETTPIYFITLNLPQEKMEVSSFGNFVLEKAANCARSWNGYGYIFDLYYPEDTGLGCIYRID